MTNIIIRIRLQLAHWWYITFQPTPPDNNIEITVDTDTKDYGAIKDTTTNKLDNYGTQLCIMTSMCMFRNIISLPLPLILSILHQHDKLFGSNVSHGISLVLIYAAFSDIIAWSFGSLYIGYYTKGQSYSIYKLLFSPPVIGASIGLFIGLVSPIRELFYSNQGEDAVFYNTITLSVDTLGTATNPCLLVLFGAYIYDSWKSLNTDDSNIKPKWIDVVLMLILTLIVTPGILVMIIMNSYNLGILPKEDLLLVLVLLVEACTPTTMDLPMICQNAENKDGQALSVILMLYQYLVSIITLTCWLSFIIVIISQFSTHI